MKRVCLLFITLLITLLAGGCIQTPAKVASSMPTVLNNVSKDVGKVTGPIQKNVTEFVVGTTVVTVQTGLAPISGDPIWN
jgi:hypothetical protein